jgi:hypothetical protein
MADKKQAAKREAGKHVRVRNYAHAGYRRAGVAHPHGEAIHAPDAFSDEQIEQMQGDKSLAVDFVDAPKEVKPAAGDPGASPPPPQMPQA